jgi:hypothetical protein
MTRLHKRVVGRWAGVAGLVALLSGCSQFNMTPACEETGPGLMRQLAVPGDVRPDPVRLARIMKVRAFQEIDASYNARTCRAEVVGPTRSATLTYRITQSEGVQKWYVIEVLDVDNPDVQMLVKELRDAYVG